MMKNSITNELKSNYIDKYLEKSSKLNYLDLKEKDHLKTVFYKDLPKTIMDGYPLASDYINKDGKVYSSSTFQKLSKTAQDECDLRYHYLPLSHELYIGTTGSGKTTGCVEPQLRAISSQKNKPDLFITDPKGEIFERNARHLNEQGYKIFILNFKDITHSDKWNPLLEMYEKKMSTKTLGTKCKLRRGKINPNLIINAPLEQFADNAYVEYDGRAFPNGQACDYYISFQRDYLEAEIDALVNQFANMIIKVQSKNDASWEYGALQLLKGIILCMLDDAANPETGFTKEMMTLNTIQQYYDRLRIDLAKEDRTFNIKTHPLLKNKSRKTSIALRIALDNAPRTMMSYCGVFDGATKDWFQGHIFALTTGNTIDILSLDNQPFAIFIITRDYEKSDFTVAGMFIDWVYRQALERAEKGKRLSSDKINTRALHFLLDEFGNIPEIRDFENKIATSRSRNIWFHLVVQSYEQLNIVYDDLGKKKSTVIIDNCNAQIFLGAQSRDTKDKFSHECGMMWVPSLASTFIANDTSLTQVAVIPISDLDLITEGEIYIKRLYTPVIQAHYIRSYICARKGDFTYFNDRKAYDDFTPLNMDPFNGPRYTYKRLYEEEEDNQFDLNF